MNFGNLGIAMGAGAEEMKDQRRLAMQEAAEGRAVKEFGRKEKDWATQDAVDEAQRRAVAEHQSYIESIQKGDHMSVADALSKYHTGSTYLGDTGSQTFKGNDGKNYIAAFPMNQGQGMPQIHEITPELVKQHAADVLRHKLETADSRRMLENMDKSEERGFKSRQVGAAERTADAAARKADSDNTYKNHVMAQPTLVQLGDGRIGMFKGDQFVGAYGSARPVGVGSSEQPLSRAEQAQLMELQTKYAEAVEGSPEQRNIAKQYQLAQNGMMLNRGRAPSLPAGMVNDPRVTPQKPIIGFEEYSKQFPAGRVGAKMETDIDVLKRYNKFIAGGVSAGDKILQQMVQQGQPKGQPQVDAAPYATRRGMGFVVVDPANRSVTPVAEYERKTGNAWADLPVR